MQVLSYFNNNSYLFHTLVSQFDYMQPMDVLTIQLSNPKFDPNLVTKYKTNNQHIQERLGNIKHLCVKQIEIKDIDNSHTETITEVWKLVKRYCKSIETFILCEGNVGPKHVVQFIQLALKQCPKLQRVSIDNHLVIDFETKTIVTRLSGCRIYAESFPDWNILTPADLFVFYGESMINPLPLLKNELVYIDPYKKRSGVTLRFYDRVNKANRANYPGKLFVNWDNIYS